LSYGQVSYNLRQLLAIEIDCHRGVLHGGVMCCASAATTETVTGYCDLILTFVSVTLTYEMTAAVWTVEIWSVIGATAMMTCGEHRTLSISSHVAVDLLRHGDYHCHGDCH
jgi:uncharacterized membrane protein